MWLFALAIRQADHIAGKCRAARSERTPTGTTCPLPGAPYQRGPSRQRPPPFAAKHSRPPVMAQFLTKMLICQGSSG